MHSQQRKSLFVDTIESSKGLMADKHVIIVGGGFAGLNAAKKLGNKRDISVTLIDRRNHHLFQPLLYQVATAGLSPADIAQPIRSILSKYRNIQVLQEEVVDIDPASKSVITNYKTHKYEYLVLACGVRHAYFGNERWEEDAPGLKSIPQAIEIRRRVLRAFESAERTSNPRKQKKRLTFAIVGGGPTGVELAGAIAEMSRNTLAKDFRNIDPTLTRIVLIEGGPRILSAFDPKLSARSSRDLEKLGVQIWTNSMVTKIDQTGVEMGEEKLETSTVVWAAGVAASTWPGLGASTDKQGRIIVGEDLSLKNYPEVFVLGDQAHALDSDGKALPGLCPVAIQQGRFLGRLLLDEQKGRPRMKFKYADKGMMATIGRNRAIVQTGRLKFGGFLAWWAWLLVHIYYLIGFKNRLVVLFNWAWSYLTFKKGARLITSKSWRFYRT